MVNSIVIAIIYLIGIAILLIFNELNYRRMRVKGEITRKFAHFTATMATIPFPYIFDSHWHVLMLAVIFFLALILTQGGTLLKSIHDIKRKSMGSYLLPFAIYISFLISNLLDNKILFILPMLILAICDPMAAILGMSENIPNGKLNFFGIKSEKTIIGTTAFFVTSFTISIIALYFNRAAFDLKTFYIAITLALATTLAELSSWRGSDNLSIPLFAIAVLLLLL